MDHADRAVVTTKLNNKTTNGTWYGNSGAQTEGGTCTKAMPTSTNKKLEHIDATI